MKSSKPLTFRAYLLERGTKRERTQLEQAASRVMLRAKEDAGDMLTVAAAIAQASDAHVNEDDDLRTLVAQVKDDPRATAVLGLMNTMQALRQGMRELQDAPRKAAAKRGSLGGKKTDELAKSVNGLTHTMKRRKARFEKLKAVGMDDGRALDMIAHEDKRSTEAVRQSLTAAGVAVSTKGRQGRRR